MTRNSRTTFSTEFKRDALQLLEHGGKEAAQLGQGKKSRSGLETCITAYIGRRALQLI